MKAGTAGSVDAYLICLARDAGLGRGVDWNRPSAAGDESYQQKSPTDEGD